MKHTHKYLFAAAVSAVLVFSPAPAYAELGEEISFIRVEGTQRVERETVLTYMVINEGMVDEAELVDRSVKTLFASGLFSDVTIRRKDKGLIVSIVENPIINRIAFEGNTKIDSERLGEESSLRPRQIYTRNKVQDDVERFVEIYRRTGRFAARIDPKIIQLPQNRIDLIFEIDEGPVTGIRTIKFLGNSAFTDRRLREEIITRESRWWRFLSANDNYDPDRIAYDAEVMRRFYLSKGYADFRVINTSSELTRDGKEFFVTFAIDEGAVYEFGKAKVVSSLDNVDEEVLQDSITHDDGQRYDARAIDETIDNLVQITGELGFAFADVRPRVRRDRKGRVINIDYVIEEGERVYVQRININGNDRTQDQVVRRELRLAEGDAFNRVLLSRSERSIRGLDYFESVEVSEHPGSTEDQTVIDVDVREKSTGELNLGVGFSSASDFSFQVGLRERNFLGRGYRVQLNASVSKYNQTYVARFTEPYFLGRDLAAGVETFRTSKRYRNSDFRSDSTGAGLSLSFPLSQDSRFRIFTNFSQVDVGDYVSRGARYSGYKLPKHEIGYYYSIDKRNDFIIPTEGWNLGFGQTIATPLGDFYYLSNTINANAYHEIAEGWVLHGRLAGGYIESYKDGEIIRVGDTYFQGGTNFRGFDSGGVGPRLVGSNYTRAIGAKRYAIGSLEISLPLGLPRELGIRTNIFSDFGFVGDIDTENYAPPYTNRDVRNLIRDDFSFRATYGLSISWRSPFGPIRMDFARPIKTEDYDEDKFFRFSVGTSF